MKRNLLEHDAMMIRLSGYILELERTIQELQAGMAILTRKNTDLQAELNPTPAGGDEHKPA